MFKRRHTGFWFFLVILLMPLIWVLCDYFGFLTSFEYGTLNWRYDIRDEIDAPVNLVYVDIDSKAIEFLGERPVPRTFFAHAIKGLIQYGNAKVIGMDVLFSDSSYSSLVNINKALEDTANLKDVLDIYPQIVLAAKVVNDGIHLEGPDEKLISNQPNHTYTIGLINIAEGFTDTNFTEWLPLFEKINDQTIFTLALEITRLFYDLPKENLKLFDEEAILYKKDNSPLLKIPLTNKKFIEVNWFSKWISPQNSHVSLKDLIDAHRAIENGNSDQKSTAAQFYKVFNNAVVLIGEVDPLLNNLAPTPFDPEPVPKIGIHGNLVKTLISGKLLKHPGLLIKIILVFLLTLIAALPIAFFSQKSTLIKIIGLLLLPLYLLAAVYLFNNFNWILPIISPIGAALSTCFLILLIQLINTEKQRNRIKNMFGTYISPELVNGMIDEHLDPQLGGQEKMISALFSDIENFSSISESLSPNALIELMNEYLSEMTAIIQEEKGTLDKYVGDAIISMFGAPIAIEDHALAACRTACRMQLKQLELCKKWHSDERRWPEKVLKMKTRFGISTGLAVVGNMGSKIRFNYTMLGDNVNLASRCEQIGKTYGVYAVATDSTRKWAENKDGIAFRFLDKILIHENTETIEIHEVLGFKKDLDERTNQCLALYEKGITNYIEGKWNLAIAYFEQSALLEPHQNSDINPSKFFLSRCQEMKLHHP